MSKSIEPKYITTPAGNVATYETVMELAQIVEDFNEANNAAHEEIRRRIDLLNGTIDQLLQISEQVARILEHQVSANEKLDELLSRLTSIKGKLETQTKRLTPDRKQH